MYSVVQQCNGLINMSQLQSDFPLNSVGKIKALLTSLFTNGRFALDQVVNQKDRVLILHANILVLSMF